MPNRRALTRGGALEATVLENLRQGHSVRAACAAAGVPVRTYYNHHGRSPAFRHDVEVALAEAERRLVGIVLEAAATDAKHAEWLLSRRWPAVYGDRQQIDMQASVEHQDAEVMALARRYSGLTEEEVTAELRRLDWVAVAIATPGADDTGQQRIAHGQTVPLLPEGAGRAEGDGAARPSPADKAPETATAGPQSTDEAEPGADGRLGQPQPDEAPPPLVIRPEDPPVVCPHCNGAHQAGCPIAVDTIRIDPGDLRRLMGGGDPR